MKKEEQKQEFIRMLKDRLYWLKSRYDSRLKNMKELDGRINELTELIEQLEHGDALTLCQWCRH